MAKKYYGCIDGLRTIAAIGIVMMHMKTNNSYQISSFIYDTVIGSFTNFVFLFMVISAFGMCIGYYDEMLQNKINISSFYMKRVKKILPFFGLMVLIDLLSSPSVESFYEAFANLTLMFGFLPDAGNISVIGVGWFLGLIFVFYLCFPFFCFLIENKRRAWFSFGISIVLNYVCANYFHVDRQNIAFSACFFMAGGLIYLYRDRIAKLNRWIILGIVIVSILLYYKMKMNIVVGLGVSMALLIYAIVSDKSVLRNRITKFIGSISFEIYLAHMAIFRIVEMLKLNTVFGNGWLQYVITVCMVLGGTIIFAIAVQFIFKVINNIIVVMYKKKLQDYGS